MPAKTGVLEDELPVVFFIAQRSGQDPEAVTGVHSSGLNWMQVAFHFHLSPWIFYTFLNANPSHTVYEHIYDEYKNPNNKINLTDKDMINLINLKFLSEYYGRDPKEVFQMKVSGKTFQQINDSFWGLKADHDFQWDVEIPTGSSGQAGTDQPTPSFHRQHKGSANGFTAPE